MTKEKARAKWVEALRSGKYQQGRGRLKNEKDQFCCLGVATDLFKRNLGKWDNKVHPQFIAKDELVSVSYLPTPIRDVLGLGDKEGNFRWEDVSQALKKKIWKETKGTEGVFGNLAELNDAGVSFKTIADLIETEPEGLFETKKDNQ